MLQHQQSRDKSEQHKGVYDEEVLRQVEQKYLNRIYFLPFLKLRQGMLKILQIHGNFSSCDKSV